MNFFNIFILFGGHCTVGDSLLLHIGGLVNYTAHTAKELKKEDGNNSELPTKDPKIKHENASKDSKKSSGNNGTSRDRATKKTPLESKKDPEIDKGATVVVTKLRHFDD